MSRLRNTELSLYFAIQETVSDSVIGEILPYTDGILYKTKFKPLIISRPVTVYINGVQTSSGFEVNYLNGEIVFNPSLTPSDEVKVDYDYCFVTVRDDFPDPSNKEDFVLPMVVITHDETLDKPLEIGTSKRQEVTRYFEIWVAATRGGQRNDIAELIREELFTRNVPLIDYNLGFPLLADGRKNPSFDSASQTIGYLYFENPIMRSFRSEDFGLGELNLMLLEVQVVDYVI